MNGVLLFILGAIASLLVQRVFLYLVNEPSSRASRWIRHRQAMRFIDRFQQTETVRLGGIDLGFYLTAGYFGGSYSEDQVGARNLDEKWSASDEIVSAVRKRVEAFARQGNTTWYDGRVYRLTKVRFGQNDEDVQELDIETQETNYFSYLGTNYAPKADRTAVPVHASDREKLAGSPFANALTVDVTVVTSDDCTPIMRRSKFMPIVGGCWQTGTPPLLRSRFLYQGEPIA
jgi:hypothetical protein